MTKHFVTLPFPYMNGRLHVGHGYLATILDFNVRFNKIIGNQVFYPFSFHGTGMPIVACANKVKLEINDIDSNINDSKSQLNILSKMGVDRSEFENFQDPYYWVTYFSQKAKEDLTGLNLDINFNSSFYTTSANQYFDKFIKWQFNKLYDKGYLIYDKYPVIYSPKDNQTCADHDRSEGEGIGIKSMKLFIYENFIIPVNENNKNKIIGISLNNQNYVNVKMNDQIYITSKRIYENLKYQQNIEYISDVIYDELANYHGKFFGPIIDKEITFNHDYIKYYEPDGIVISRSGCECVVAIIDQWFIDYSKVDKEYICNYIDNSFKTNEQIIKNNLKKSIMWYDKWPVSRSFGIGTQLLDTEYLIESLSDSTIYMALYTIYEYLINIDVDMIDDNMFDAIFLNQDYTSNKIDQNQIIIMKNNFEKWYPVDIRISGKDLVNNHLTMCLMNHYIIWEGKYMPKKFWVTGHVNIKQFDPIKKNVYSEKMSKSKGNFITINDITTKYDSDVIRCAFASFESGLKDASFDINIFKIIKKKIGKEMEFIKNIITKSMDDNEPTSIEDLIFMNEIIYHSKKCYTNLENGNYKVAFDEIFNYLYQCKEKYIKYFNDGIIPNINNKCIMFYISNYVNCIQIFAPSFANIIKSIINIPKWDIYEYECDMQYIMIKDCITYYGNKIKNKSQSITIYDCNSNNISKKTINIIKKKYNIEYNIVEFWINKDIEVYIINKYFDNFNIIKKPNIEIFKGIVSV